MSDKDLRQLRRLIEEAVRASGRPVRELERALGIGHGNLYHIFDGRLDLRVRHLLAIAQLLGVPPTDFLEIGCPEAMEKGRRRLGDLIGRSPAATPAAAVGAPLPAADQLRAIIREAVRDELAARDGEREPRSHD